MITPRAFWISLGVGIAIVGALSAWSTRDEPAAPAAVAQCYWLSNEGAGWVTRPDLADAELCFEMDSCSGGVGLSGGGCYKWAIGADAPAAPWIDLGFSPLSGADAPAEAASGPACYHQGGEDDEEDWVLAMANAREAQCFAWDNCSSEEVSCVKWAMGPGAPALPWSATLLTNPQLAADIPPPQDIYAGTVELTPTCDIEDCHRFTSFAVPIYARTDTTSPVVGELLARECVMLGEYRIVLTPLRGVVLETRGQFTAGDVIYSLGYGQGYWRRGEVMEHDAAGDAAVRWDADRSNDPRVGHWREVTRSNGASGWTNIGEFSDPGFCDP